MQGQGQGGQRVLSLLKEVSGLLAHASKGLVPAMYPLARQALLTVAGMVQGPNLANQSATVPYVMDAAFAILGARGPRGSGCWRSRPTPLRCSTR